MTLKRLPEGGRALDRSSSLHFSFDGRRYAAHPGDTIGSALAAGGVEVLSRSFKYHRPRGQLCCAGHCPNCLVQVGDEPSVRACMRPVEEGLDVRAQNVWPSLRHDVMSLARFGSKFMPAGFYYKTFIRPRRLWPLYEGMLRRIAGLGVIDPDAPPDVYDKQYLHGDVVVIGGGPAGIAAAHAAAETGARVLLFDENDELGGHLRFTAAGRGAEIDRLVDELASSDNVELFQRTSVLGWYQDRWLAAMRGSRLFKIRAGSAVLAAGAFERPLQFDDNDLPGVMLGSAVQRLLHLYGVVAGERALVVTANEDGWEVANDLLAAGANVVGIVDERPEGAATSPHAEALSASGIPVHHGQTILAAKGSGRVAGAKIARADETDRLDRGSVRSVSCDLIAVSIGWTPDIGIVHLAGGKSAYDDDRAEMVVTRLPDGLQVAGRAAGTHEVANQLLEGRLAGRRAAAGVGLGSAPDAGAVEEFDRQKSPESCRSSARVSVPGGKGKRRFVCVCEDVTEEDIRTSIEEGYDSIELLKRYSTVSMGPCQGRMCSMASIQLCARETGRTIQETGTTTSRPPIMPVAFGALAGQKMEPVRVTALHGWHLAHGAREMVAGVWMRAEHYGDPTAEVKAVRERVGLIDVSSLGKFRLTGPGIPDLLQRLYVNKWRKLGVGRVRYGVMCNDEGVVLDDGVTARLQEEEWYMSTTSSGSGSIYEWIQWWVQSGWGDGVHVTNLTESFSAMNLAGPRTRELLSTLTEVDLSNEAFPYMAVRSGEVAGVPCRLLRIGFTGELSFEIHCPSGYALHLWEALIAAGEPHGILPFGVEAQRILRLEKGHIIVGHDTDGLSDAISANIEWAVKLDKTDFLGIRNLSRVSQEGPRQRLVGFEIPSGGNAPQEGMQVVWPGDDGSSEIIGWITSCRHSPTLDAIIGLAWLPTEIGDEEGATFTVNVGDRLQEARVHHGAFYDPAGDRLRS